MSKTIRQWCDLTTTEQRTLVMEWNQAAEAGMVQPMPYIYEAPEPIERLEVATYLDVQYLVVIGMHENRIMPQDTLVEHSS